MKSYLTTEGWKRDLQKTAGDFRTIENLATNYIDTLYETEGMQRMMRYVYLTLAVSGIYRAISPNNPEDQCLYISASLLALGAAAFNFYAMQNSPEFYGNKQDD